MVHVIRQAIAQQIVETVKDISGCDANFIDSHGFICASTNESRIGDYHEIGHKVILTGQPFEVSENDTFYGTQRGVNMPFVYNGEIIGAIGITGEPEEVRRYGYLAQKITMLILREQDLNVLNHNKKSMLSYVIHALISNENINHEYYMQFLEQFSVDEKMNYRTVLIRLHNRYNPINISLIESYIYGVFERTGSPLYTFFLPNEYICLLTEQQWTQWKYAFEKMGKEYSEILKIGVGQNVPLRRQQHSYKESEIAIASLGEAGGMACVEELDLEILMGDLSEHAVQHFLDKVTSKLSEDDQKLLTVYFENGLSLKVVSDKLFLHKNTIQYRLNRISELTGYNPRVFKQAVVLYMGLLLTRLK